MNFKPRAGTAVVDGRKTGTSRWLSEKTAQVPPPDRAPGARKKSIALPRQGKGVHRTRARGSGRRKRFQPAEDHRDRR